MLDNRRRSAKAGVTLIELLVVVLIIIILSVALLPVLIPFVVSAKYATDGIPQLGNMRTKVQLFMTEHEYLPGLYRSAEGIPCRTDGGTVTEQNGNSCLTDNTDPAFVDPADAAPSGSTFCQSMDRSGERYAQGVASAAAGLGWDDLFTVALDEASVNHYAEDLQVTDGDLSGRYSRPQNYVYAAPVGKFKGQKYLFVVAVIGDGEKLPAGTAYAVLEVYNPKNVDNKKIVATWKRWKPEHRKQPTTAECMGLVFTDSIADPNDEANYEDYANNIYVPMGLVSETPADTETAVVDLRRVGWDL
jgi:type II secretory pathway pseudopilin PulG